MRIPGIAIYFHVISNSADSNGKCQALLKMFPPTNIKPSVFSLIVQIKFPSDLCFRIHDVLTRLKSVQTVNVSILTLTFPSPHLAVSRAAERTSQLLLTAI
jgi:hypothetical protein